MQFMIKNSENPLDPEFDVLPYENRRDATVLKAWHGTHMEKAARFHRIGNWVGALTLVVAGGFGVARLADVYELPDAAKLPAGIATGLAFGVAGGYRGRSRQEEVDAARNAEIVAGMFTRAQLESPAWTQPTQ